MAVRQAAARVFALLGGAIAVTFSGSFFYASQFMGCPLRGALLRAAIPSLVLAAVLAGPWIKYYFGMFRHLSKVKQRLLSGESISLSAYMAQQGASRDGFAARKL